MDGRWTAGRFEGPDAWPVDGLARGGADPSRPAVHALSPGELRVFELIGRGLSSRQVATTLRRTVKTVETHVSRIKRKLGVANAAQLAQMAAAEVGGRPGGEGPT